MGQRLEGGGALDPLLKIQWIGNTNHGRIRGGGGGGGGVQGVRHPLLAQDVGLFNIGPKVGPPPGPPPLFFCLET